MRSDATRPKSTTKDLDKLLRIAWKAGWPMARAKSGHIKVLPPNSNRIISVPLTASSQRTAKNIRAEFRKHGLDC